MRWGFSVVLLASCAWMNSADKPNNSLPNDLQRVMGEFSKDALRAHMRFLADDLLEGRGTGTRGQELASKYVAAQFEAAGLQPAGINGTYFQQIPFREITVDTTVSEMSVTREGRTQLFKWGGDFIVSGNERNPDSSVDAPVVFVGFGVVDSERNYDDYEGVAVKGKIVAYLSGAPPSFPSEERAHFASPEQKIREAAFHGAVGAIRLETPDADLILPWERRVIGAEMPAYRWLDSQGTPSDSVPEIRCYAHISIPAARRLFADSGLSWDDVLRKAQDSRQQSVALPVTVRLHAVSRHRTVQSPNVVAVLRGSDPQLANEYVVYSAHTDHVGIGRPLNGDSIYNGAVDDASGTSALIELARAFANLPKSPARSVLFLATTAEEQGLLGADYFARFPTVPAKSIVADLNMDGASIFYTFNDIVPLGAEHTTLGNLISRDAARLGLKVSPDPQPEQINFVRADHYAFVRQGIPAVTIAEGMEAKDPKVNARKFWDNWNETRYHAPSDDMDQPLNFDATIQFVQINFLVGYDLAQQKERPAWKPGDFFGRLFAASIRPQ